MNYKPMNYKKILFCTVTAIVMLAPIGAVGLRYSNDIKSQLTQKEMIEQLEFKKIEKDVTIKLYPSLVKKEVDGSTKYFYTPESVIYNDGTELKGATAITLPFDKKINDKQTRTTLFKGKAYLLKCRIPDALMDQKEKAATYGINSVKEGNKYYIYAPYKVKVGDVVYENEIFKKIVKSDNIKEKIKEKAYKQYKANEEFRIRQKLKRGLKYTAAYEGVVALSALGLYTQLFIKTKKRG